MTNAITPTQVRITDTDPARRRRHPADAVVCRPDRIAESLQNGGWFDTAPAHIRDAVHALQRAVLAGVDPTGLEEVLGVRVEPVGIDPPAGATWTSGWEHADYSGAPQRLFTGTLRGADRARVGIDGFQWGDGRVERWIWLGIDTACDNTLTAAQARELAQHLVAAADELEALNTDGQPSYSDG